VNAKLVTYEWGTYLEKTGAGEHPMAMLGWTGDNGDPDNFLYTHFHSANADPAVGLNIAFYKNPQIDNLLEKAQTTVDENVRRDTYYRAQEILLQDAPWVAIAYVKPPIGLHEQVRGFVPNPVSSEAFNPVYFAGGQ
jgi:peptide/nickel transport system substrate-binding protein